MRRPIPLVFLCLAAACLNRQGPAAPAPVSGDEAESAPAGARESRTPSKSAAASLDTLLRAELARPAGDSLAQLKAARDSALDAAMLERLATAAPPESAAAADPVEGEAAALRSMFDIDVATYADHARVRYYLDFFTGSGRGTFAIWLGRLPRWEQYIRNALQAKELPGDLVYLALIESGFSNRAVSRSRAVGMWQFMSGTARLYGLRVDRWMDERRDPVRSTEAAVRFLSDLTEKFGSTYLAAAAYNGGPGRVQRGIRRLGPLQAGEEEEAEATEPEEGEEVVAVGSPGDAVFFQLADTRYIHRETKDYVPKLIAATMIAKQPERYGFPEVPPTPGFAADSVLTRDATDLAVLARLADVPLTELRELNPHLLRGITPPGRRSRVLLPVGRGAATQASLDALPAGERVATLEHKVRSGETPSRIARRYGLTVADLRGFNPVIAKRAPRVGETLRIPGSALLRSYVAADDRPASRAGTHRVRSGETLSGIAGRYRVRVAQLQSWNGLGASSRIRAGQVLRVRVAAARKPTPAGASGGRRVHLVQSGDTLSGLAQRYGVSVQALQRANGIRSPRSLRVGQRITIPS